MTRRCRFTVVLILVCLTTLPVLSRSDSSATALSDTPAATAESYADCMTRGNLFYDQRDQAGSAAKAVEEYKKALAAKPEDYEALWRLSRSYWWVGDHSPKAEQAAIFDAGKMAGERAQKADSEKSEGYYWFSVNLGRSSEVRGIMNSLFAIDPIKKSLEKALAIAPQDGFTFHVLGVLYRKAPGWPLSCGDMNQSLAYAQKAVEYAPEDVLPRIGLAETLLSKGKKDEARALLEKALTLPGAADKQPETKKDKKTAEELLNRIH